MRTAALVVGAISTPYIRNREAIGEDHFDRSPIGTRKEWLTARLELLQAEKALTRRSDELAQLRQELPWVRIEQGVPLRDRRVQRRSLADLFRWTFSAADLSLHVRTRLLGGLSFVLSHC